MSGNPWCDGIGACLLLLVAGLVIGASGPLIGPVFGPGLILAAVVGVMVGILALILTRDDRAAMPETLPQAPERTLDERFARGELTRQEHYEATRDILTARFIRGELDVRDYEDRTQTASGRIAALIVARLTAERLNTGWSTRMRGESR
jgi:uncharacterized membrane protein